jgi:hypothetical protein
VIETLQLRLSSFVILNVASAFAESPAAKASATLRGLQDILR